ncbi:MAG: hypothetical protein COV67_11035 [Nitrospinae bacterium CG11_big_fil_rev_8_21_14_0_20_56_8]|nr:MAG: hypothetical protein COV67_11035 [Nitrospinae bacterium CG11_big_fil_rev_8_21_14_0_20_56_8]
MNPQKVYFKYLGIRLVRRILENPIFSQNPYFRDFVRKLSLRKAKRLQKRTFDGSFAPWAVEIELTNGCNIECVFCPNPEHVRPKGMMSLETFQRIASEIKKLNVPHIIISGFGEPTLDKNLVSKLEHFKTIGISSEVMLVSNGTIFNPEILKEICDRELVDIISISVDAGDEESYVEIHKKEGYAKIRASVEYIAELKLKKGSSKPKVDLRYKDFYMNKGQIHKFIETFSSHSDKMSIYANICTWPGADSKIKAVDKETLIKIVCPSLYQGMRINWNGDVVICPQDYEAHAICGNILKESMLEIWNGEVLSKYRKMHENYQFNEIPVCKDCDINTHLLVPL